MERQVENHRARTGDRHGHQTTERIRDRQARKGTLPPTQENNLMAYPSLSHGWCQHFSPVQGPTLFLFGAGRPDVLLP